MFAESLKAYYVHSSIVITLEGACTKYEENWYILVSKGAKILLLREDNSMHLFKTLRKRISCWEKTILWIFLAMSETAIMYESAVEMNHFNDLAYDIQAPR